MELLGMLYYIMLQMRFGKRCTAILTDRLSWHEIVGTFCKDHSMEFAESNISNISSIFRGIILNLLTGLLLTRQIIL